MVIIGGKRRSLVGARAARRPLILLCGHHRQSRSQNRDRLVRDVAIYLGTETPFVFLVFAGGDPIEILGTSFGQICVFNEEIERDQTRQIRVEVFGMLRPRRSAIATGGRLKGAVAVLFCAAIAKSWSVCNPSQNRALVPNISAKKKGGLGGDGPLPAKNLINPHRIDIQLLG